MRVIPDFNLGLQYTHTHTPACICYHTHVPTHVNMHTHTHTKWKREKRMNRLLRNCREGRLARTLSAVHGDFIVVEKAQGNRIWYCHWFGHPSVVGRVHSAAQASPTRHRQQRARRLRSDSSWCSGREELTHGLPLPTPQPSRGSFWSHHPR